MDAGQLRADLASALAGGGGALTIADRLCRACVELLAVDGAAISVLHDGASRGTFGSSGALGRRLDEFQFTFGEGPCIDAVHSGKPILVGDIGDVSEHRWPAFGRAAVGSGIRAVFALPVALARTPVGALDLFCHKPGVLSADRLGGGLWAAELAALPLLDLMTADFDWTGAGESEDGWEQLASLQRVEVYQATGMIIAELDVDPAEALVRLRAYAYARGLTASEAAWAIVERRIALDGDSWEPRETDGGSGQTW